MRAAEILGDFIWVSASNFSGISCILLYFPGCGTLIFYFKILSVLKIALEMSFGVHLCQIKKKTSNDMIKCSVEAAVALMIVFGCGDGAAYPTLQLC